MGLILLIRFGISFVFPLPLVLQITCRRHIFLQTTRAGQCNKQIHQLLSDYPLTGHWPSGPALTLEFGSPKRKAPTRQTGSARCSSHPPCVGFSGGASWPSLAQRSNPSFPPTSQPSGAAHADQTSPMLSNTWPPPLSTPPLTLATSGPKYSGILPARASPPPPPAPPSKRASHLCAS